MSFLLMLRKCEKCKKAYPYNPSVGDFGTICPKCGKIQENTFAPPVNPFEKVKFIKK